MVGLPIMPIYAPVFRPPPVNESESVLGRCGDNGLSRVCCMDGWHLHLHIGDCINSGDHQWRHTITTLHIFLSTFNTSQLSSVSTSGGNVSRRKNQESSLKPASAKMCVAGGTSNEPSWSLKFYNHGEEKALHGVLNVKALVRCFQPGEGPSRGLLRDCWL